MPDPVITSAAPPVVVPGKTNDTFTQGLNDPAFASAMDAAFASKAAGKTVVPPRGDPPSPAITPTKTEDESASPPEPTQTSTDPAVKDKSPASGWKELKRQKAEAEEAAARHQEKIKELETKLSRYNDEDIGRTKQERDDYEKRLKSFAVEHDPQFEAEMNTGMERIKREAKLALGDKASRFLSLLSLPEGDFQRAQLSELTTELDDFSKQDIYGLLRDHRRLTTERQLKIESAKENYDKLLAGERQREQDQAKSFMAKFDDTLRQWQDKERGLPALQLKEGDDAHNTTVRDTVQRARNLFSGTLTPDEMIKAALWSAISPNLLTNMNSLSTENAQLREEIKSLKSAEPGLEDRSGGADTGEDAEMAKMSYPERMAWMALKQGAFQGR